MANIGKQSNLWLIRHLSFFFRSFGPVPRQLQILDTPDPLVFVVGKILSDGTVKGGTGWGAEFAKLCNKELYVFDQDKKEWLKWHQDRWGKATPKIRKKHFAGGGTRFLTTSGKRAIADLYKRSFK